MAEEKTSEQSETTEKPKPKGIAKKIILGIFGAIAVAVIAFLVVVMMQPSEYTVTRTGTIDAPPSEVFPHVNDLSKWQAWSPWAERDPNAKEWYSGPDAGEGAVAHWDGNDEVGAGSMTITQSKPDELIELELTFIRPMEGTADVEFNFSPQGDGTEVAWHMHGENNLMGKMMCLFMDLDKMIGDDYEEGLANLKRVVEEGQ